MAQYPSPRGDIETASLGIHVEQPGTPRHQRRYDGLGMAAPNRRWGNEWIVLNQGRKFRIHVGGHKTHTPIILDTVGARGKPSVDVFP